MKNRIWKLLLLMGLVSLLSIGSAVSAANPIVLRWAHIYPPDHPFQAGALAVAKEVAAKTNNQLQIQVFPAGQLGSEKDIVEGVASGTIDMVIAGPGELGKWYKPLLVFEAAYLFRDVDHMYKVVRGPVGKELTDGLLKATGMRILDVWYYGTRHVTTTNRLVKTPQDMKGLKLRAPDMPMSIANAKAMGANPTPMAFAEVYLALQQGVVDGQENPIATIATMKFNEVQKYLILTGHVVQATPVVISDATFKKLPAAYQKVLVETVTRETDKVKDSIIAAERKYLEDFKKKGMTIATPDVASFQEAAKSLVPQFENTWGKGLYEKIQAVK